VTGMKKWLTAISVGLAVAAAVYLLNWPSYKNYAGKKATLVEVNGAWALVPVSLPILLTLLPLLFPNKPVHITVAVILCAFVHLAGMTIGLYYAPATIMHLPAGCVPDSARLRDALP
jgi:hypothetical protein